MDNSNEAQDTLRGLQNASSQDVTLAYMKTVSTRIDRAESDFVDHIRKVEHRLDQLVDLVRDVAALKQQYTATSEAISELRGVYREQTQRVESSIARVHLRLDELTASVSSSIDAETSKIMTRLADSEQRHTELDIRFKKWLNRGIGGWAMFVLVIGALQTVGIRWLSNIDAERTALQEQVVKLKNRVADLENRTLQQLTPQQ